MKISFPHWKTTAQSWLTVIIGLPPALSEFTNLMPHKVALGIAVSAAVGKVILGQMQKDAGETLGKDSTTGEVKTVPAHEIPDDPAIQPVAPSTDPSPSTTPGATT